MPLERGIGPWVAGCLLLFAQQRFLPLQLAEGIPLWRDEFFDFWDYIAVEVVVHGPPLIFGNGSQLGLEFGIFDPERKEVGLALGGTHTSGGFFGHMVVFCVTTPV